MTPENDNNNGVELGTQIESALNKLSTEFKVSSSFLLWSSHGRVPAVLNFRLKRAYQEAGLCDKNYEITEFGHAVFDHLKDQYEKTGKPEKWELPKVASSMSME